MPPSPPSGAGSPTAGPGSASSGGASPVTPAVVEVTNTLRVPYVTGIQRTVRQVIRHWPAGATVPLLPVVHTGRVFRRLTDEESAALLAEPSGPGPEAPPAGGWRGVARRVPGLRSARDAALDVADRLAHRRLGSQVVELGPGSLLFDLEATWWSPADRVSLLPELERRGVRVATLIYDLMLLRNPEWFDPHNRAAFTPWAQAQLAHADLAVVFSDFCARDVAHFGGEGAPPTALFTPGADPVDVVPTRPDALPEDAMPFALVVSTVEPRKNIGVVLEAFEMLWREGRDVRLVIVGRQGWDVDDLVRRLGEHPERGRRLIWTGWAADAEVDWLYRHAAVVTVPSFAEGYGLPVVEGRRRGAPVISSDGGALAEIGDAGVARLSPTDVVAWADALRALLARPRLVEARDTDVDVGSGDGVIPTATWADAAAEIEAHLAALVTGQRPA